MSAGFKWWDYLGSEYLTHNAHVSAAVVGAATLLTVGAVYTAKAPKLSSATVSDEAFVPSPKFGLRNTLELSAEFVQDTAKSIIGSHYDKYLPLLVFIFLWTLLNNVMGMVPGLGSTTDNLNTTLAMGITVFIYYNAMGFVTHGFRYLEHFTGHLHGILLLILGPVMFVIETISHMVRPVTLGMRLRSNIYADHQVVHIVNELLGTLGHLLTEKLGIVGSGIAFVIEAVGPVPLLLMGLLVCLIQAFVFTLLTTIYIGLATSHDEEH